MILIWPGSASLGIPESVAGCHFAQVGRYIIEGHVPVDDILRLLDEQPNAMGLALPGMLTGSPGMETEGKAEKYSVQVFLAYRAERLEAYGPFSATRRR